MDCSEVAWEKIAGKNCAKCDVVRAAVGPGTGAILSDAVTAHGTTHHCGGAVRGSTSGKGLGPRQCIELNQSSATAKLPCRRTIQHRATPFSHFFPFTANTSCPADVLATATPSASPPRDEHSSGVACAQWIRAARAAAERSVRR